MIPSDPITTKNQFVQLSADDSEDDAEDVPDIDIPRVASSMPNMSFEPEMVLMEAVSDIVMLLGDMERVRLHIEGLWKDYKSGHIDLMTAAVTTNTALDILQRPHDKLMARIMPLFDHDFGKMLTLISRLLRGHMTGQFEVNMPNSTLLATKRFSWHRSTIS